MPQEAETLTDCIIQVECRSVLDQALIEAVSKAYLHIPQPKLYTGLHKMMVTHCTIFPGLPLYPPIM